ncbi:MAG: PilN domain-containing protein [Gammaproteobacteria bacterium]|nr:PilN domain-containing protein [Gammaproteobacteria bacterium]MBU6509814.1 PilN domain-containing protein [Gammaproteobacteria bacterium]MDE1983687.1 PilN domain-containing protein [Gammaproteobacteria bacterium]MDE2107841.1 PilN domain-containing protein [Gammaproteobacteria bacterium]MDE2460528.1 PilN domain-containing protein [Gammaproteobacteria bacterium]
MPSINLLPWREERRKVRQQTFQMRLVLAAIVAIVVLVLWWLGLSSAISNQTERNTYLSDQIKQIDKQIADIKTLQQKKAQLLARMNIIEQLQASRMASVHLFDQLVKTLPAGVYLTQVSQNGSQLTIQGVAESSARVSTYMRNIDASAWMSDPNLQVVQKDTRIDFGARAQQFTLTAKVLDSAKELAAQTDKAAASPTTAGNRP